MRDLIKKSKSTETIIKHKKDEEIFINLIWANQQNFISAQRIYQNFPAQLPVEYLDKDRY